MKTKPLNNNVLIEVQLEHDNVARVDENEVLQYGKLIAASVSSYHITASSFGEIEQNFREFLVDLFKPGMIVRWEQYAEGGQTFNEDGKKYALIPWWRLISVTDNEEN